MTSAPSPASQSLPIDDVLEDIAAALENGNRVVVSAPPGAGKTTRVPLRLLDAGWARSGKITLVQPRRIAARAAAERMAATLGERVGQTIGLRTRMDVRISQETRIEVVTEGVFTRQILSDPAIEQTACVIFDEFHERSLDADEGAAFALDTQEVLRPDLRIIVMSATLPEGLTDTFFKAPVVESDGRMHPVETRYLGFDAKQRLEDQVASAIRKALNEETGSILAFLPGAAEIRRTQEKLEPAPPDVMLCPLYGALSPKEQSAAIAPPPAGVRKVVIATDIAESALTIEGVRVVVDGGFARLPRHDPSLGATRLETVRIARANADQRRGRAGRTQPGVCYRLWREAEMGGFPASPPPEIESADLTNLRLDLANWGANSPDALNWLTPPRPSAFAAATAELQRLGALDDDGALTPTGKRLGALPVSPQLAMMILDAAPGEAARDAARTAALLSERDLGGRSTNLTERLARLDNTDGPRERAMRKLADRWAATASGPKDIQPSISEMLATAMPNRIARARPNAPGQYLLASGRGAFLDQTDALCRHEWLVVADVMGGGANLRITLATPLDRPAIDRLGLIETTESAKFDIASKTVRARRRQTLGAITLEDAPLPKPPPAIIRAAVIDAIREHGFNVLSNADVLDALINRVQCLRLVLGDPWPDNFRNHLMDHLEDWLPDHPTGAAKADFDAQALRQSAIPVLEWPMQRDLESLAPLYWTNPAGALAPIDYSTPEAPSAACPIQQVFGLKQHPAIAANRLPLTLSLLSPATRPIAITRDIASFWAGGYADVRKDMKARYPKHFWPENPENESATIRTTRPRP